MWFAIFPLPLIEGIVSFRGLPLPVERIAELLTYVVTPGGRLVKLSSPNFFISYSLQGISFERFMKIRGGLIGTMTLSRVFSLGVDESGLYQRFIRFLLVKSRSRYSWKMTRCWLFLFINRPMHIARSRPELLAGSVVLLSRWLFLFFLFIFVDPIVVGSYAPDGSLTRLKNGVDLLKRRLDCLTRCLCSSSSSIYFCC